MLGYREATRKLRQKYYGRARNRWDSVAVTEREDIRGGTWNGKNETTQTLPEILGKRTICEKEKKDK